MSTNYYPLFAPGDILEIDGIEFVDIVLYAVIYGLCRTSGCCFASNEYLANRMKLSRRSVQRSMKRLHGFGLIFFENDDNNRRIYIKRGDTDVIGGMTSMSHQDPSSIYLINKVNKYTNEHLKTQIELLYKNYPIKKGKTVGVKRLLRQIKSDEDLKQLEKAIKNYASECKGKEEQYIKHFSTFAGCWQDYLEASPKSKNNEWTVTKIVDGKLVSLDDNDQSEEP